MNDPSRPFPVRVRTALANVAPYKPGRSPTPAEGVELFKLSSNENPYPPLPSVRQVIDEAGQRANLYPSMDLTDLCEAVARLAGVSGGQVVPGQGSSGVLQQIVSATVEPGDEVVYAWRSFELYPVLVSLAAGRSVQVPLLPDGRHDLASLAAAITERTRLVLLCSPNNPTGPVITHDKATEFLGLVPPDVLVVADEAYIEFNRDPEAADMVTLMAAHPNLVVARTFSKAYGLAGLRVGYALAHPAVAEAITTTRMPFTVTDMAQQAALASLEARDELLARVDELIAERTRVVAALSEAGWRLPTTQANFVWLPLGKDTAAFVEACEAAGLSVRGFAGEGVRASLGVPAANDKLIRVAGDWVRA